MVFIASESVFGVWVLLFEDAADKVQRVKLEGGFPAPFGGVDKLIQRWFNPDI